MGRSRYVTWIATLYAVALSPRLLAQSASVSAPQLPMFIAVSVQDLATTAAWYRSTFDLPATRPLPLPEQIGTGVVIESPSLVIELLALRASPPRAADGPGNAPAQGIFKAGFAVADLAPYLARFRAMGTRLIAGPFDDSAMGRRAVIVADPEGNRIHLLAPLR